MQRHRNTFRMMFCAALTFQLWPFAVPAQPSDSGVKENPLREAYFGDLHLHTSYSFDAYISGTTSVTPDEAYRFAKGDMIEYLGHSIQRREPLDFLAVTDHAEIIGVAMELNDPASAASRSEFGRKVKDSQSSEQASFWSLVKEYFLAPRNALPEELKSASAAAWGRTIAFANRHYRPGQFTTFIGYEWTGMTNGANLHRNVIFKGDKAPYPFTSLDSKRPEDLWAWLEEIRQQDFEALAIPHNSNASNGLMYDWIESNSPPIDLAYARARQANEPLSEIAQVKGASETHPTLSPTDEFADYQIMDYLASLRRADSRPQGSYVRDALSRGLVLQRELGVNPYKYGFAGASDLHGGLSVTDPREFAGHHAKVQVGNMKLSPDEVKEILSNSWSLKQGTGNLTGVWAHSNTRDAIYGALRRRETFATSGPKLRLRFFGGWQFGQELLQKKEWIATAYTKGVPMGADLPTRPATATGPSFVIWAIKDPNGANLDRVQVVKVWEQDGKQQERIYDVVWSGARRQDAKGRLAPVASTVDLKTGRYSNSVGAAELRTVWQDPDFDQRHFSAYYLRVLEIPTPRWSTLLALSSGMPLPETVPATTQERAWSSPIWFAPAASK